MNILLIFFAFPIAVIIVSAILEKILRSPVAVAALIFAIFLVLTFAVFDEIFLIATLVYTIIAFITALIVHFLKRRCDHERDICDLLAEFIQNNSENSSSNNNTSNNSNNNESLPNTVEDLLLNSTNNNTNSNSNDSNCNCNRFRRR